jgi:rSAM/selenodomain-associated transferase 2/rSAM/selenodomain-associated transferase 1
VIVPVWRDRDALARMLGAIPRSPQADLVIALSADEAADYDDLRHEHAWAHWITAPRGRAAQMNAGATISQGRWLLFLHADSRPPADWLDVIGALDARTDIIGGAFTLALDAQGWQARLLELGVRVRVRLFRLPYGDQGIFVRREVFSAIDGFADLPLMEDVDLVRRLARIGRLHISPACVTTSARRWQREGWITRSARNLGLLSRYMFGASPGPLAQQYFGRKRAAIVMMGRAPWTGGKSRIPAPDASAHVELREALFYDTLRTVGSVANADHLIACEPAEAAPALRMSVSAAVDVIAQRGDSLGDRLTHVFRDVFRLGYDSVVVIGSDLPDLPSDYLRQALRALASAGDVVVLGPATDGGYYLMGLNRAHDELFQDIPWSTASVMADTLRCAGAHGLPAVVLAAWRDVDDAADLARFLDAPDDVAPRTCAWAERWRSS